jgi:hypothetical protein
MKKSIPFLLFILIANFSSSQILVDTVNKWNTKINRLPSWTVITESIKFEQDTAIDSKTYKKVWRSTDEFQEIWLPYGFIRETPEKKIYYRTDTSYQEYLLYDFELSVNDTIFSTAINSYANSWHLITIPFIVSSIDSMLIGNEYKKQIHLYSIPANEITDQWIEGMGSMHGILHWNAGLIGGDYYELLCFYENDTLKYQNPAFDTCYIVYTNIEENPYSIDISVYPNPVTNISTLTIKGNIKNEKLKLEIFNITGEIIISERIENKFLINRDEFNTGIYFFKVFNESGMIKTGKLMIK